MKKIQTILNLLMLVATFCCSLSTMADPITVTTAKSIAKSFMRSASEPVLIDMTGMSGVRRRAIANQPTQSYYVFSRGVGEGFVIVSGNDALPEVLGYADTGDFDYDKMPPALQDMLSYYSAKADSINDLAISGVVLPKKAPRKAAGTVDIPTLMTSHWHQSWPYNNFCPHLTKDGSTAATGCVATAASQIIYYWRKECNARSQYNTPTYSYGDAPATADYQIPKNTPFKWDLMKDSYSSSDNEERLNAVATMVACVGMSAWLTYGSSTSGQIDNCRNVFSSQMGLNGGVTVWRGSYSQTSWEKMIVNDLTAGRPILYSGVHPTNGGHAVVVDGYNVKNNLFHFNFGWGGQGDGYYTVDDAGMNGFSDSQGMVYQIYPKNTAAEVEIVYLPDTLQVRDYNTVRYRVTNNGTLPLKGFYLYCSTSTTLGSNIADTDDTSVIQPGESAELTFSCKPTTTGKYYVTLADKNKTALYKKQIPTKAAVCDLTLNHLTIKDGDIETQETVAGESVSVRNVYNVSAVDVTANITNSQNATSCIPTIQGFYETYDESTGTFTDKKTKSMATTAFDPGMTRDVVYSLTGLKSDVLYRFTLANIALVGKSYPIQKVTADTVLYFRLAGATDMTAERSDDGKQLTVKGHYNAQAFSNLAADSTICSYDMREVEGLSSTLTATNLNALFYAKAEQQVAGRNIIVDGVTAELDLTPGYDFAPLENFKAMKAVCHVQQAVGRYGTICLPFKASVPHGMYAQKVDEVTSSINTEQTSELQAGVPYIILTGTPVDIVAEGVDVVAQPSAEGIEQFSGTFFNHTATSSQFMLDDEDIQYFSASVGSNIPALTAYTSRRVRVCNSTALQISKRSRLLAQTIASAQETLTHDALYTTDDAQTELSKVIESAKDTLSQQPAIESQTQAINALNAALTVFEQSHLNTNSQGYGIVTWMINNPSFESTVATTGWTRSKATDATVQKLNTSTNFMGGIDGEHFMKIQNAASIEQTLENVPNGVYQLVVSTALDYDKTAILKVGDKEVTLKASDFGPYIFQDITVDDITVTDHTLTIMAAAGDDWLKVDDFQLYQKECTDTPTGILPITSSTSEFLPLSQKGVFDLTGRKLGKSDAQHGIYIIDGKKIIK